MNQRVTTYGNMFIAKYEGAFLDKSAIFRLSTMIFSYGILMLKLDTSFCGKLRTRIKMKTKLGTNIDAYH